MPFNFTQPIVALLTIAGGLIGGWYFIDKIGDLREAQVRAEYARAAHDLNVEIGAFNNADEAVAIIQGAAVQKYLDAAAQVQGKCPATPEQAKAITAIRRVK